MIADGDLIVCSLGRAPGADPFVGRWPVEEDALPTPLELTPGERRFLSAISLPEFLTQLSPPIDDEQVILQALRGPFTVGTPRLEELALNASLRSRSRSRFIEIFGTEGVKEYLGTAEGGRHAAPRLWSDVVEILRAGRDSRWDDARRLLQVTTAPAWPCSESDRPLTLDRITLQPTLLASPAAQRMLERVIEAALQTPPPTVFVLVEAPDVEEPVQVVSESAAGAASALSGSDADTASKPVREREPKQGHLQPPDASSQGTPSPPTPPTAGAARVRRALRSARGRAIVGLAALVIVTVIIVVVFRVADSDPDSEAASTGPTPPTNVVYVEVAGGPADVHEDYRSLAGVDTQAIGEGEPMQVACRILGVRVGSLRNPWWYLLASPRFRGRYVTADAFYNNGASSGPLKDTPLVDPKVQRCEEPAG